MLKPKHARTGNAKEKDTSEVR